MVSGHKEELERVIHMDRQRSVRQSPGWKPPFHHSLNELLLFLILELQPAILNHLCLLLAHNTPSRLYRYNYHLPLGAKSRAGWTTTKVRCLSATIRGAYILRIMRARRRNDGLLDILHEVLGELFSLVPAWTSIPVAAIAWASITILVNRGMPAGMHMIGFIFGAIIGVTVLAAGFTGWSAQKNRARFLTADIDLAWIQKLTWRQFEEQVAAVYERRGYSVQLLGGSQADGGVDVRLKRDGTTILVQCKHWRAWKVGVKTVRELFGVMTAEGAASAILITSGHCTDEARRFTVGKPITLIEQAAFVQFVRDFQRDLRSDAELAALADHPASSSVNNPAPTCPTCGSPMVRRTARKSSYAGNAFWGCSRYPQCRGIRNIPSEKPCGA